MKDVSLGGGIWRIKWHPSNSDVILTATMYNGFHIVNSDLSKGKIFIFYGTWTVYYNADIYFSMNEKDSL